MAPAGGRVTLTARRAADWIQIEVADTGEGIQTEDLPQLFDPSEGFIATAKSIVSFAVA